MGFQMCLQIPNRAVGAVTFLIIAAITSDNWCIISLRKKNILKLLKTSR